MGRRKTEQVEADAGNSEASRVSSAPAGAAPEAVSAWRVVKATHASVNGQRVSLYAGKIIAATAYGSVAISSLFEQGVELEPVA